MYRKKLYDFIWLQGKASYECTPRVECSSSSLFNDFSYATQYHSLSHYNVCLVWWLQSSLVVWVCVELTLLTIFWFLIHSDIHRERKISWRNFRHLEFPEIFHQAFISPPERAIFELPPARLGQSLPLAGRSGHLSKGWNGTHFNWL